MVIQLAASVAAIQGFKRIYRAKDNAHRAQTHAEMLSSQMGIAHSRLVIQLQLLLPLAEVASNRVRPSSTKKHLRKGLHSITRADAMLLCADASTSQSQVLQPDRRRNVFALYRWSTDIPQDVDDGLQYSIISHNNTTSSCTAGSVSGR